MDRAGLSDELVLMEMDRFCWTLIHAGPAFDTIFRMDRMGSIFFDLIDFAWTNLSTITANHTFLLVHNGIHTISKTQILIYKSKNILEFLSANDQAQIKENKESLTSCALPDAYD